MTDVCVTQSNLSQRGFIFAVGLVSKFWECSEAERSEQVLLCWSLHVTHRALNRETLKKCKK